MTNALALRARKKYRALIEEHGEALSYTRRATTQGGSSISRTIRTFPQPLSPFETSKLEEQGGVNIGAGMPHKFFVDIYSDVAEALDFVTYNGWVYRLLTVQDQRMGGISVVRECVGVREVAA